MRNSTLVLVALIAMANSASAQELVISGVIDGPLSGGVPKAVEVYVVSDIPDLSIYGVGSANNGGGSDGEEFTFPAVGASAGDFIYVTSQAAGFNSFFGFGPDYTSGAMSINGDDAIELFKNGVVVDLFGEIDVDGTGDPWEYLDGWAYRFSGTGPDGSTFVLGNWSFSGPNALDGESSNATAATPFPMATFSTEPMILINEVDADQTSTDSAEFVELFDGGLGNTDLSGLSLVLFNGSDDASYLAFDLDGFSTNGDGYFVLCGDAANVVNCDLDVSPDTNLIQNGADAVALLTGDAVDFPNDTPVTTGNLLDAIVYDTSDSDDAGLLVLLNAGQPQVDERGGGNGTGHSNQRCANGSGGARNTDTFAQFAPTPGAENICVAPAEMAFIHEIQGSGLVSPEVGNTFIIEGIVVGDFQDGASGTNGDLNGFYVQEEDADADADALTSEGIFVFNGSSPAVDVAIGDLVRVEGVVSEFSSFSSVLTEITSFTGVEILSSGNPLPTASAVTLPVLSLDDHEAVEGMLVTFPQALVISDYFNFDRFNEIVLTSSRHLTPTAEFEPGPDALQAAQDFLLDRIILDDGRTSQNPDPAIHPNGMVFDLTNLFRGGDTVQDVTGVMHESFDEYRINPTEGANYVPENLRTDQPAAVGGNLKVASFNVFNYFTTLDEFPNRCGPNLLGCRGADNAEEFTRQRDKIIAAISAIDADVVGVIEIENNVNDDTVIDLVDGLNAAIGAGTYDYVSTGPIGTDAIKNALIYKPAIVSLAGDFAFLDNSVDPRWVDRGNRPALAQAFMERSTGGVITVAVNHLRSKGSACGDGDDSVDGAGNCNGTRTLAAAALVDWLATDPTGSGNNDHLIIGDLNSYDKEDPIDVIRDGGFTDLIHELRGEDAYTYVFGAQIGYLDYALASAGLLDSVAGVAEWHVNADEPDLINYDTGFKGPNQDAIYAPDAYRASDHDPVIVGLDVCDDIPPTFEDIAVTPNVLWPANHKYVDIAASVTVGDNGEAIPTVSLVSVTSNEPDNGKGDGNTVNDIVVESDFKYMLRAERAGGGSGRIYTITYLATDSCDNSATATATVTVPHSKGKKGK